MKKCKNVRLLFFPHGCLIFQSYISLSFLRRIKLQARIVIICIISISLHKEATMIRWEVPGGIPKENGIMATQKNCHQTNLMAEIFLFTSL